MYCFKIEDTEIILQNYEFGQGKIIISNTYGYNFSTYWGSMRSSIEDFLLSINEGYFITKLSDPTDNGVFDPIGTVRNIRKYIREECKYDLPWYKHLEFQKSLRDELKEIERFCENEYEFVDYCQKFPNRLDYSSLDRYDECEVKSLIDSIFKQEPWNFIEKCDSQKTKFLKKLFPKIKKHLKSIKNE